MEALNKQVLRVLKLFGNDNVKRVTTSVGPEQEYFLIDRAVYDQRKDLVYAGRTLFGAKPPKGQELDDHYFGSIKPRVAAYMEDLNKELWKLGIMAKTEHNEVAPAQHELAIIYTTTNIATDHNQLTMEVMQKVAARHGLVCLLREKPFAGVNGSGKHNNWSMSTDAGVNTLPRFTRDTTDHNRTSPFAFTGNKFEFRLLGSSDSLACPNIMLNTAVAESLRQYADKLEGAKDFPAALHDLIRQTIINHKRIIFNSNGYDDSWIKEATEKRGLLNLRTTPDAMAVALEQKNIDLLTSHKVMSQMEFLSRHEILLENYCKTVRIEALTMIDRARREILPAVEGYTTQLAKSVAAKKGADGELPCGYEKKLLRKLSALLDLIDAKAEALERAMVLLDDKGGAVEEADAIRDAVIPKMCELRAACDEAETVTAAKDWPFPTYGELLFSVR